MRMNQKKNKRSDDFWSGQLSLDEEQSFLNEAADGLGSVTDAAYARFVHSQRNEIPSFSEEDLWNYIQRKERKRFLFYGSVAASFLLIAGTLFFVGRMQEQQKLRDEFALLEQTLRYVSEEMDPENIPEVNVLYEDDFIVIVSEN